MKKILSIIDKVALTIVIIGGIILAAAMSYIFLAMITGDSVNGIIITFIFLFVASFMYLIFRVDI